MFSANPINNLIPGDYNNLPYGLFRAFNDIASAPAITPIAGVTNIVIVGASVENGIAKSAIKLNKNTKRKLINLCEGAASAENFTANGGNNSLWTLLMGRLPVPAANVQVIVTMQDKESYPMPLNFDTVLQQMTDEYNKLIPILQAKFPNFKHLYIMSRPYSDWAQGNAQFIKYIEPSGHWNGWAVKIFLQQYTGAIWMSDGPYIWTNGAIKRADGFQLLQSDFQPKNIHMTKKGYDKCANHLLKYCDQFPYSN